MKLYNSGGPNPRMVRMFMAEKGFDVAKVDVDLRGGENRRDPYLKVNPAGQCPALELDDGTVLAEITAICEYVDEKQKDSPSLIGDTSESAPGPAFGPAASTSTSPNRPPTASASPKV
jgi:glutathione S-transferase